MSKLEIRPEPGRLYAGVTLAHNVVASHPDGSIRKGVVPAWRSSDPAIAKVDRFGYVTALRPGAVTITAEAEGIAAQQRYTVAANPVATLEIGIKQTTAWTGDVIRLSAAAKRANGTSVTDAPVT